MPREIYIKPDISGLDDIFQNELRDAKTRPGTLESILGLATGLPMALSEAKMAETRKGALGKFATTGEPTEGLHPESVAEAVAIRKAITDAAEEKALSDARARTANARERSAGRGPASAQPVNGLLARAAEQRLGEPEGSIKTLGEYNAVLRKYSTINPEVVRTLDALGKEVHPESGGPAGGERVGGPAPKKYRTPEEVRDDAGLSLDQKKSILRSQFGFK